jgi:acetyl-CoA acyltransferase 2
MFCWLQGICDGAAALVLASEEAVKTHNLKPLARMVAWQSVGVDPAIMGIGPVPAIRAVLSKTKLKLDNIDLIEVIMLSMMINKIAFYFVQVNEAFAPQALAVQKDLGIPLDKFNVNGGAIALGHPLGASGARISAHLAYELK